MIWAPETQPRDEPRTPCKPSCCKIPYPWCGRNEKCNCHRREGRR